VLFVKTLRVELIVTSKLLKYKFSTMQGLQMALAILSVLLVLMVILTAVNPQFATEVVEESQTGQLVHIISCATLSLRLEYALYALEGLVLLANAKVRVRVRDGYLWLCFEDSDVFCCCLFLFFSLLSSRSCATTHRMSRTL
jgi:hypothetical protein